MNGLRFIVPKEPPTKARFVLRRLLSPLPPHPAVMSVAVLLATSTIASGVMLSQLNHFAAKLSFQKLARTIALQRPPPSDSGGSVLGISISKTKIAVQPTTLTTDRSYIQQQILSIFNSYISQGLLKGEKGDTGPQGPPGSFTGASTTGLVQSGNGQAAAVIGGVPIVSYVPALPSQGFAGTSLAGFGNLSAGSFVSDNTTINGSLNVSGATTLTGTLTAAEAVTLATTTAASLTVSGNTTLNGSTTIAGLTVTSLNPGLTLGSIAFQGASGLTQDNSNLFYDATNHRLGVGTSTATQLLTVAGNALFTGNATTSGNQVIGGTLSVISTSTLGSTTAASLTVSGASLLSTLSVTGQTTLASASATALTVSGPSTLAGTTTLATTSIASLTVNGNSISGSNSGDVTLAGQNYLSITGQQITASAIGLAGSNVSGILNVANGGTGASALTAFDLLVGNGTSAVATITPGTVFQVLRSAGAAANPTYSDIGGLLTAGSNISISGTSTLAVSSTPSFTNLTVMATSTLATITATSLTTTGNVGIGNAAPATKLDVGDGSTGYTLRVNTTNGSFGGFRLDAASVEKWNIGFAALSNDNLIFRGGAATNVMALTTGGNVGIGTTSPTGALVVQPASDSTTAMQFVNHAGTSVLNVDTTNGRVGIGTNNVGSTLTTIGTIQAMVSGDTAGSVSRGIVLSPVITSAGTPQVITGWGNATGISLVAENTSHGVNQSFLTVNPSYISFNTSGDSTVVGAERVRIDSSGNVGIGTTTPTLGPLTMASGAYVTAGGTWTNASDRNLKENFATLAPADILQKIDQLPVTEWDYKSEGPSVKHIGPVAQDFWDIFHIGNASTSISTIDPSGVALLGIQALDQKITALQGSLIGNATATNLTVYSPSNFSGDSVGQAEILAGQTSVRITFAQAYQYQPIVTITPEEFIQAGYRITDKDATGFTIEIEIPASTPVTFDWHSFASLNEQLSVSDGTTQAISLVVERTPAPSAPQVDEGTVAPADPITTATSSSASTPITEVASSTPSTDTPTSTVESGAPTGPADDSSTPAATDTITAMPLPLPSPGADASATP